MTTLVPMAPEPPRFSRTPSYRPQRRSTRPDTSTSGSEGIKTHLDWVDETLGLFEGSVVLSHQVLS